MRRRILTLIFGCLAIATSANAGTTWLGAQFDFPTPSHDLGADQLGIGAGITLTNMATAHVGTGLDLAYHYWPASRAFKATYDRYLRGSQYREIASDTWAFKVYQATPHLRFVQPLGGKFAGWAQGAAGFYLLDPNLSAVSGYGDGITVSFAKPPSRYTYMLGANSSIGIDVRPAANVAFGLDATYHHLWPEVEGAVPSVTALTVGTHMLVGW